MAESFNLNNFLNTYKQTTYDPTKRDAAAKEHMEKNLEKKAEEAVKNNFLSLTVGEKIKELGFGPRVAQQLADTALGRIKDLINPLTDYLNKYENIFDENMYKSELQSYAKQTFFASYAMKEEDDKNPIGRNFTYEM